MTVEKVMKNFCCLKVTIYYKYNLKNQYLSITEHPFATIFQLHSTVTICVLIPIQMLPKHYKHLRLQRIFCSVNLMTSYHSRLISL